MEVKVRSIDIAREHGLSTQAIRNYEEAGLIPRAQRSPSGYRDYTAAHAAGVAAYMALIPACGYPFSRRIMLAVTRGALDEALELVDQGHALLARDRDTLRTVETALKHLGADIPPEVRGTRVRYSIGELAGHLRISPATLRAWERAGVLNPQRDAHTGHRQYHAQDVRDAELAHLLRRGGQPLSTIRTVLVELRDAGSIQALKGMLAEWRSQLRLRGLAQMNGAARLFAYINAIGA
ncbi:MerR family transcriptional regulator [Phycicoccus elongatus Lp2]|uniref:MerR family transcriptional regulator n=1 Tax=Phycicoccus elongatus Lp2 TaxID=1193181 RepID=N0E402_9MICO|nr:MerR family DNA-binding transcriptional regulator [Phycicoccus elongatus]CCH70510.1 MerR family transcriptional regulator [Phycicoccus elongatus Lp2]